MTIERGFDRTYRRGIGCFRITTQRLHKRVAHRLFVPEPRQCLDARRRFRSQAFHQRVRERTLTLARTDPKSSQAIEILHRVLRREEDPRGGARFALNDEMYAGKSIN